MEWMQVLIEQAVRFTVLYLVPPGGNHYKRPCRYTGRDGYSHLGFKRTKETNAYYDAVTIFAQGRTVAPATDAERRKVKYAVEMDVYLGPRQRGDFDNFWKCGLDALVHCGMIHSDAAVDGGSSKCTVHRADRENPRTTYFVSRMETL
jgi:Holliday junction resolvase RusA-like endonuclease